MKIFSGQLPTPDRPGPAETERRSPFRQGCRAGLRLIRAPNLLTAPGDPLAGAVLAGGPTLATLPALGAAAVLYAGGVALNDVMDAAEDRVERPDRPIPRGWLTRRAALAMAAALLGGGMLLAFGAGRFSGEIALAIAGTVAAYDVRLKRTAVGPWCMGACRGLSLWMGAAAAGAAIERPGAVAIAALGLTVYTAAITALSQTETAPRRVVRRRWAPAAAALTCAALAGIEIGADPVGRGLGALLAAAAAARAVGPAKRWNLAPPVERRRLTGQLVSGLVLLQGAFIACAGAPFAIGGILWTLWAPLQRRASIRWASD
jgi:4-hydroxybenzoate polyprenyltransferase